VRFDTVNFKDATQWRLVKGNPALTYIYQGPKGQTLDLAREDLTNTSRWFAIDAGFWTDIGATVTGTLFGAADESSAFGGLVVRNDVRSDVAAGLQDQKMTIAGDVSITANERATILALDESSVTASATGVNVVIATNLILGDARAFMDRVQLTTTASSAGLGDVDVAAYNNARIAAFVDSSVKASTAVGVTLAFNTIGYAPQNLLANIADSVLGTSFGDPMTASTIAGGTGNQITAAGRLSLTADWAGSINATVKGAAVAISADIQSSDDQSAITIAPVVAMNKIAADVKASLDNSGSVSAASISVQAKARTQINAQVAASAVAVAASASGGSKAISVGLSLSRNDISSEVQAFVQGPSGAASAQITARSGELSIGALRGSSITAQGTASAVAVAASAKGGPAVAGGGTLAFNRISGNTDAFAQRVVLTTTGSDPSSAIVVQAQDSASIDAFLRSVAVAVSVGGQSVQAVALGLSVARNIIGQRAKSVPFDFKASERTDVSSTKLYTLTKGQKVQDDTALLGREVYE
jgi:hypothetical protein